MSALVLGALVAAGVATMAYPSAAAWLSDRAHATTVSSYVESVAAQVPEQLAQELQAARQYNSQLPSGPLRDPFTLQSDGSAESVEANRDEYDRLLAADDEAPLARLRIPSIRVDLPVYHGTDAETLDEGVGHLYGSSLPVGGAGTHAVLSAHSGMPSSTLLTHLEDVKEGELFYVEAAGETLAYKVDQISVVAPDDADQLRRVAGEDYVTLLTCTPTGVNTHRLLVRGERVPSQDEAELVQELPANAADPGFPWWALPTTAGMMVAIFIAWPRRSEQRSDKLQIEPEPSTLV